jgi:hypothetical protein
MQCTSGKQGSGTEKRCINIEPFSVGALTPADRTRRSAALTEIAAAAKSGDSRQITAMPLRQGAQLVTTLTAPSQCGFLSGAPAIANPDRFTSCADSLVVLTDYFCDSSGNCTPTGDFSFEDQQWESFSGSAPTWDHGMITLAYSGHGDLTGGASGVLNSACWDATGACNAVSLGSLDPQAVQMAQYSTYYFEWSESDDGASATQAGQLNPLGADDVLGVYWSLADGAATSFDVGIMSGRCDSIATSTDGCVDDAYTPILQLSLSQYGASAAMIDWAQQNLSGHWGLQGVGQPMHYLSDTIVSGNNREVICPKTTFPRDPSITSALAPYGDTDSCDEFPFAASFESGAMSEGWGGVSKPYVTTGDDCAQVTAVQTGTSGTNEAADWSIIQVNGSPSGTEPCVRGHIPALLNSGVGGKYGSTLVQQSRMINGDQYWVQVTA